MADEGCGCDIKIRVSRLVLHQDEYPEGFPAESFERPFPDYQRNQSVSQLVFAELARSNDCSGQN